MQYSETLRRIKHGLCILSGDISIELAPLTSGRICVRLSVTRDAAATPDGRRIVAHDLQDRAFRPAEVLMGSNTLICLRTPDPVVPELAEGLILDLTPTATAAMHKVIGPLKDAALFAKALAESMHEELNRSCSADETELLQDLALSVVVDGLRDGQAVTTALGVDLRREIGKTFIDSLRRPRLAAMLERREGS